MTLQEQFNSGVISKQLAPEKIIEAQLMFDKAIDLITKTNPSEITYVFVTHDESFYIHFEKNNFSIHAEFFFTEVEIDGIELVLNVYNNDVIVLKQAGMISDIWKYLLNLITK